MSHLLGVTPKDKVLSLEKLYLTDLTDQKLDMWLKSYLYISPSPMSIYFPLYIMNVV